MSLKSVLISMIVAGVLAGLVVLSRGIDARRAVEAGETVRTIGIDPVAVVSVRAEGAASGAVQSAHRAAGTVDSWTVKLDGDDGAVWDADATRVRTVLRALGTTSVVVSDDASIGEVMGSLVLEDREGVSTEVRFGSEATGGYVRVEVVDRGRDGIATRRWFGRVERTLRDSLVGDRDGEGMGSWRSMELFGMTVSGVMGVDVSAGGMRTVLARGEDGWRVVEPWESAADSGMVQGMLGLTLGLKAERFYDAAVYTDDLTGLSAPIARIVVETADGQSAIEIGTAVDNSGKEVFARYTTERGGEVVMAVKTEGLTRLTASPMAYVHQSAGVFTRADLQRVEILGTDGAVRFGFEPRAESWVTGRGAVSAGEGKAIERLVKVLGNERAMRVVEDAEDSEGSEHGNAVGEVRVTLVDGRVEVYGVGIESVDGGGMRLRVSRSAGEGKTLVWVLGSEDAAGTGAWIATLGARGSE